MSGVNEKFYTNKGLKLGPPSLRGGRRGKLRISFCREFLFFLFFFSSVQVSEKGGHSKVEEMASTCEDKGIHSILFGTFRFRVSVNKSRARPLR